MQVIVCDQPDEATELAANEILAALEKKPDLVLGLATGSTPIGIYSRLVRAHQEDKVDFSRVRTFNLDEFVGPPSDHPRSYRSFMRKHLFDGVNVNEGNIHFPPVEGPALRDKCRDFEATIRDAGGIDIQILGIGRNGHIGFNEPTSSLASRTRIKTLTEKTLLDNSRFDREKDSTQKLAPTLAATAGIGTILDARRIMLQAFGRAKAEAVRVSIEGPISSFWPGSALQLHDDVTFYLDLESSALLTMVDYYRQVRKNAQELEERGLM